jgi:hypothetical protein
VSPPVTARPPSPPPPLPPRPARPSIDWENLVGVKLFSWIAGVALFQNSFGQFSQYVFGGLQWRPIEDNQPFYVKLTAGPLHGYSGQYKNKLPYNSSGVAPAIIPGVGYCVKRYCGEFVLLGANAALFTIGVTVP